jgi:hypothetical protein
MKAIQNDFTQELTALFNKHHKTIDADKEGIYFPDTNYEIVIFIQQAETASENYLDKLMIGIKTS